MFLSPEAPYPPVGGGAMRSASLLEYLRQERQVDLVLFHDPAGPDPRRAIPPGWRGEILALPLPFHARAPLARITRNLSRLARGAPPLFDRFSGQQQLLAAWLEGRSYEWAVVEHFWCAPYLDQLRPHAQRTLLDLHNVESEWHARCGAAERGPAAWAHHRFARSYRSLEQRWLPQFDNVLTTSLENAQVVQSIAPVASVTVYPNAIPWHERPKSEVEHAIVFSGNLLFHPNQAAVRFFRKEVWPALREQFPRLQWWLLGKNPEGIEEYARGDNRIAVIGPVDDALFHLAKAEVAVVPILAGSGTRIKILEAWAAGVPVVSTTIGAEGLGAQPGREILVADSASAFVSAVGRLLRSEQLRSDLSHAARLLYERQFTWKAAWAELVELGL